MAVLKCKMCGGELQIVDGENICECEYCGSKQTVPTIDNEKKITLFDRANRLRMKCEFDKAAGIYESIVAEFPEEAEGYWGLCLCKYGIEYVDDPETAKKIPTCHRTSFEGIFKDENFELAQEYADMFARDQYRTEAKEIDRLQRAILEIAEKEEPFDIFICYKDTDENGGRTKDSVRAQEIYMELVKEGYKVFFSRVTLEDKLGVDYEPYIFSALNSAKIMLAIGTKYDYYNAVWVKNEWMRYLELMKKDYSKKLIPCYSDIDAYDMPEEFVNLQGLDMARIGFLQDLIRGINKILGKDEVNNNQVNAQIKTTDSANAVLDAQTNALIKRGYMALDDRDFERADEFFEQVLNNDAECAQAYWGKMLCEMECSDEEELVKELAEDSFENAVPKKITLKGMDIVSIVREIDQGIGFLEGISDKMIAESFFVYSFDATYESKEEALNNLKNSLNETAICRMVSSKNYERAVKYADTVVAEKNGTIKPRLEKCYDEFINAEKLQMKKKIGELEHVKEKTKSRLASCLHIMSASIDKFLQDEKDKMLAKAKAAEEQYQKDLADWTEKKNYYDENHDRLVKEKEETEIQIKQLQLEHDNLKGFFAGKQKRELEARIASLNSKVAEIIIPQAPGNKPVKKEENINLNEVKADIRFKEKILMEFTNIKGETISLGVYPKDNENDIQPIEWKILDVVEGKALLITKDGIDCVEYNEERIKVTWETCTLRKKLNSNFIISAFSEKEQKAIVTTLNENQSNPNKGTKGGNVTEDKVFLLSIDETEKYFTSNKERMTKPTNYAKLRGAYVDDKNENCAWWLRTPGFNSDVAANVYNSGLVNYSGNFVNLGNRTVRPALWVDIGKLYS